MRWAVLVSAALWACAPSSRSADAPQARSLRQAGTMPLTLPHLGPSGSELGSSLAACPGAGFVAGAPGTGTAWHSPSGTTPPAQGFGLGRAVGCYSDTSSSTQLVAGGDAGMRLVVAGNWVSAFSASSTLSISAPADPALPILAGTTSAFLLYSRATGTALNAVSGISVPAVQWYGGQPRFAVTVALGSTVRIYDWNPMNLGLTQVETIIGTAPGFGRSLAVGDVLPAPGDELIIGATGAVYVYLNDGSGPVMRLTGADSSFGASLATAPHGVGLDQLFVGEPASDDVYRFIGDAGEVYLSVNSSERFGAALAANAGLLAIGAPEHQGGGAVYQELLTLASPTGEVQECQVGRACFSQGCLAGECVGGVWCDLSAAFFSCQPGETCSLGRCLDSDGGVVVRDAGVPIDDGGVVIDEDGGLIPLPDASVQLDGSVQLDAGDKVDAGSIDAGVVDPADAGGARDAGVKEDAGVEDRDAGVKPPMDAGADQDAGPGEGKEPMIFTTSGCSESAALPLLALCLVFLRRRFR